MHVSVCFLLLLKILNLYRILSEKLDLNLYNKKFEKLDLNLYNIKPDCETMLELSKYRLLIIIICWLF